MISAFLVGTVIAFVLAMPPGPVGVTAMKLGLTKGLRIALLMGFGTALFDMLFCFMAIFATSAAVSSLEAFSIAHPLVVALVQIAIVFAFVVIGILNLKKAKDNNENSPEPFAPKPTSRLTKYSDQLRTKGPFFLGVTIALANIANPTFLPSLAYVTMQVHQFKLFENMALNNFAFAVGFGLGNFLWIYVLASVMIRLKSRMPANFLCRVRQFAGITFISFGGILGWRVLMITKWPELLKLVFSF